MLEKISISAIPDKNSPFPFKNPEKAAVLAPFFKKRPLRSYRIKIKQLQLRLF